MYWRTCVIDCNADSTHATISVLSSVPKDDKSYANAKRGLASYIHCLGSNFTDDSIKKLHSVIELQLFGWAGVYFLLVLGLFLVSLSQTAMNGIGSTLGLMIINGMVFAGMAILAAKKRVEDLRYFCEWFVFCTQILFAYGSTTSPGISSVVKCAAQLCLLSSMLAYVTQANDIAITSTFIMALAVFASVTLAFMLHAISPYETALGLYAAVVYSLVWCVYMVDESFKRVLVREL